MFRNVSALWSLVITAYAVASSGCESDAESSFRARRRPMVIDAGAMVIKL